MMDISAAARALGGRLLGAPAVEAPPVVFGEVSTDSRRIGKGALFVALRGEKFDGHDFVDTAAAQGAAAALVDEAAAARWQQPPLPLIVVADTRRALGALAADWRARFTLPLIALTGSNGKTTTKEMIAAILRAAYGDTVLATVGNLNNDIGLPLTLLGLRATHRAAIVELGMNHPGEIAALAAIARPTVALVTNAQRAHLEGMGSLDAIAEEKGTIYDGLGADGIAVVNADEPWADLWRARARRVLGFGLEQPADVAGSCRLHGLDNHLTLSFQGERGEVELCLPGRHNARNALAAAAATLAAGVPFAAVCAGLAAFRGAPGRLQKKAAIGGATLLDDTYNANPDSVRAAIDVLSATVGRQILVLGDMGEIGEMSGQFHDEIGGYAKSQGIDRLFALGEASALAAHNFGAGGRHFRRVDELVAALKHELTPETTVLVKGSRFMRMERVADAIAAPATAAEVH
ncbi:UDP-N-acetylmuramoyl-tripeptide--D-alanyl-D-alanine ligase [Rhodocyclus purpureus]|uniref:UDP-N-acetylmuramoyl-tripeptide--D-alanyl-D- alanine ligase n=1 Tax=Rhodocyclus purpureus TaxID=1067 RepID=UPI001912D25F|nr:UDP-N-acetylmuramoyl-tripeptide--D-alanyl-D-alanine ligase [Rhodocyclus purpureus]MBK5913021.1 UDP-N-acetylmuramoyl-tripeptide--D-alanyl-D-alanine ligase [Rhodocyclus purpureus]